MTHKQAQDTDIKKQQGEHAHSHLVCILFFILSSILTVHDLQMLLMLEETPLTLNSRKQTQK